MCSAILPNQINVNFDHQEKVNTCLPNNSLLCSMNCVCLEAGARRGTAPGADGGACTPSMLPAADCCVLPLPPSSNMLSTTFLSTCHVRVRVKIRFATVLHALLQHEPFMGISGAQSTVEPHHLDLCHCMPYIHATQTLSI